MSKSITLYDYTGSDLSDFLKEKEDRLSVTQVLPISQFRMNEKTGVNTRDYLLIYESVNLTSHH